MASMVQQVQPAPDLLRRFVSTPHRATWEFGAVYASVITNAEEVLQCFPQSPPEPNEDRPKVQMKVVVDPEIQSSSVPAPLTVDAETVLWGWSHDMFFAVDRELQEILIFVGCFHRSTFVELVVKLVGDQMEALSKASPWNETVF